MIEGILNRAGHELMRLYTRTALDMDVVWHAALPPGAKILAANHPTTTDPFLLLSLTPEPVSVLVNAALFQIPLFGHYLRAAGHVPAVRRSGGGTVQALLRRLERGRPVAIFPEGALSPNLRGIHPAHSGVARLALETGVPVIPVGIGVDPARVLPFTARIEGQAVPGRLCLHGRYAMTVGLPMQFRGGSLDSDRVRSVAAQVMQRIGQLAAESAQRVDAARAPAESVAWPAWVTPAR